MARSITTRALNCSSCSAASRANVNVHSRCLAAISRDSAARTGQAGQQLLVSRGAIQALWRLYMGEPLEGTAKPAAAATGKEGDTKEQKVCRLPSVLSPRTTACTDLSRLERRVVRSHAPADAAVAARATTAAHRGRQVRSSSALVQLLTSCSLVPAEMRQ